MNEWKRILELLASSPEHQIKYLEDLGVAPVVDELGLEFDDLKKTHIELDAEIKKKISLIDKKLNKMSGADKSELWLTQALSSAEEWQEIRQLAKDALSCIKGMG